MHIQTPFHLPWRKVARCPHLTGNFSFPARSAVAANVVSSCCSLAPMQHAAAAAHQQAALHQGVAVDGISPFTLGLYMGYIWIQNWLTSCSWGRTSKQFPWQQVDRCRRCPHLTTISAFRTVSANVGSGASCGWNPLSIPLRICPAIYSVWLKPH